MKSTVVKHRTAKIDLTGVRRLLPQIETLIESSRQHVVSTANLTLVWLYWNVGRVITVDIQQNAKRAGYGEQLLSGLAGVLIRQYGSGYSQSNLNDMRRFFEAFEILQAAPVESGCDVLPSSGAKSGKGAIRQPLAGKSAQANILQAPPVESEDRPTIDFSKHHRLGWTHYRILLSVEADLKRGFYFEQGAQQRSSIRCGLTTACRHIRKTLLV